MRKVVEIQQALQITQAVYDAFLQAAKPGATEYELEASVRHAAQGHKINFDLLTGPRTAGIEGGATERTLAVGDPLLLDLCLQFGDHWCDVCRTYFIGSPSEEAADLYRKVLTCKKIIADQLRPGMEAGQLYETTRQFFAQHQMDGMLRHHTGHGIGLTPFEAPVAVSGSKDILHEGDVVTVEIGAYIDGQYGIRLEDDYLLTSSGATALWQYPIEQQNLPVE